MDRLDTKLAKFEESEIDERKQLEVRSQRSKAFRSRQENRRPTDTVSYVATDQTGLTSTCTRTVIVKAAVSPAGSLGNAPSSTDSTSTAQ